MATELSDQLAAAAARTVPVVRGIRDDQLALRTPCAQFEVRDLVNHLYHVVVNFQTLATKGAVDFATTPDRTGGDFRGGFAEETRRLAEAWGDPATLEGHSPGMGLPQAVVGRMALMDLIVHGWDLAEATGQPYEPDPATVDAVRETAAMLAPQGRQYGVFGPEVEAGPDAGQFERLLALTGREPAGS